MMFICRKCVVQKCVCLTVTGQLNNLAIKHPISGLPLAVLAKYGYLDTCTNAVLELFPSWSSRIAGVLSLRFSSLNHNLSPQALPLGTQTWNLRLPDHYKMWIIWHWLDSSNDSAAKLVATPTEWPMAFPEPHCIPPLARLCEAACVCGSLQRW